MQDNCYFSVRERTQDFCLAYYQLTTCWILYFIFVWRLQIFMAAGPQAVPFLHCPWLKEWGKYLSWLHIKIPPWRTLHVTEGYLNHIAILAWLKSELSFISTAWCKFKKLSEKGSNKIEFSSVVHKNQHWNSFERTGKKKLIYFFKKSKR